MPAKQITLKSRAGDTESLAEILRLTIEGRSALTSHDGQRAYQLLGRKHQL